MAPITCPHCGEGFTPPGHESSHVHTTTLDGSAEWFPIVPDISASGGAPTSQAEVSQQVVERAPSRTSFDRRWLFGLVAAVVALFAWVTLQGGDETASQSASDSSGASESTQADDAGSGVTGSAGLPGSGSTEPSGDPNFPPSDEHMASDSIAELFRTFVDGDDSRAVVYPSPMGLQVLNARGTSQPRVEVAAGFHEAAQFPLISDGGASWAIDPDQLERAFLVSTQFFVTDIDRDGRVAFINDSLDPPNIGESSYGAWGPGFDLPPNAQVLAVPERGLFVLPSTGGTYEYVFNGVESFSDDALVAASIDSEVFQRCGETLMCELYVVRPDRAEPLPLPEVDVETKVWISPGGRWLVTADQFGVSALVDLDTGASRALPDRVRAVDWTDDGAVAALLTADELLVFRSDLDEFRSATLPIAASAGAVLIVG